MSDALDAEADPGLWLHGGNLLYLEQMLQRYLQDPRSVDGEWRAFFEGAGASVARGPAPQDGPGFERPSLFAGAGRRREVQVPIDGETSRSFGRVFQLINAYRVRGHLKARLDPLGFHAPREHPELDPFYWGFDAEDFERLFDTPFLKGPQKMTLRDLMAHLNETYSRTIGVEFMHIHDVQVKEWLQERFERGRNHCRLDRDTMVFILERLAAAEAFESFVHVKYRGAKRFGLQGAESVVPMLALMIEDAARLGVREVLLGMAHRGRLNVLVNIVGKRAKWVFQEFDDPDYERMIGRGDVKYHLGHSADFTTRFGDAVHLSLAFNPSHLEAVNPVVLGRVRAKQDRYGDRERRGVLPVLLHGDAAFSGQGVVAETMNMMSLPGYATGGTIHVVINNQIGFTTLPAEGRSTPYCTDLARMAQCPVIHVNGEDPEAVVHVAQVATDFRQTFGRDVVIDMYCFRRYGHNESDEPTFTQPQMYREIDRHPAVHEVYGRILVERGLLGSGQVTEIFHRQQAALDADLQEARGPGADRPEDIWLGGVWRGYHGGRESEAEEVDTAIPLARFDEIVRGLVRLPEGFEAHAKMQRLLDRRAACLTDRAAVLDWGMGELLAYGAIVLDGMPVRVSGQDVERGTFSHRHAVLVDQRDGHKIVPLAMLSRDQAAFEIYNSLLSEVGVLGFEYGYALESPEALVIWEAQFGDFANAAQVIIDQFIAASEDKWNRLSGLVLFLPHGYEGQGPEHSSARLERFLMLCAEHNMQVANVTTPAQMFHLLRRQVLRRWRKPLVVMTPKSLLRHRLATSPIEAFTGGRFQRVIPETLLPATARVRRAVLCSGKVYYDLLARRDPLADPATALIRVEQLYPFPEAEIRAALGPLPSLDEVVWCQEEPDNMGARRYLQPHLERLLGAGPAVRWVCREESASPATGSPKAHRLEQDALVEAAFAPAGVPLAAPGAPAGIVH